MIENYLLQYLVSFAKNQTLLLTAQDLNVTPATISRGLQKLEKQVGIALFVRKPQKIILTPAGIQAAKLADKILAEQQSFIPTIRNFVRKEIIIAATTPTPLLLLKEKLATNSEYIFQTALIKEKNILNELLNHKVDLIFSNKRINDGKITSIKIATERLFIKITKYNPLYNHKSVSFSELKHHEFVVLSHVGYWENIIKEKIPQGIFLYQKNIEAFNEIVKKSNFPIFRSNLSLKLNQTKKLQDLKRKLIPIIDPEAKQDIYAIFRIDDTAKMNEFISVAQKILC